MLNEHGGRLRAIASRYGNASTAPWSWGDGGLQHSGPMQYLVLGLPYAYTTEHRAADLEFIENAPEDVAFLLNLVAQLEQDLAKSERHLAEVTEGAAQPLRQVDMQVVNMQPLLDRAAALETALQVVAAREVLHAADRDRERAVVAAAQAAVANILDRHPGIGEAQPGWFHESTLVLVAAVQGLPTASAPVGANPHAMCASEAVKLRDERDRLADELERLRGVVRAVEQDRIEQQIRWQPQIDELTIERDAAARELVATQRAKAENDERFQGQVKDLNDQLAVVTASEAIRTVTAYALLREAATVLQRPAGQDLGWEQRRDLLARIGIVVGEDLQPELSKAVAYWPPAATPYGGCPASMTDGGRTVWCDTPWPHLPIQGDNGSFDHGNEAEGVRWNIDRSGAPSAEPDLRHPWTLGHLRRTVDAYSDFADDAFVQATVPSRPIGWGHDGIGYYTHDLLGLHVQDPREFL